MRLKNREAEQTVFDTPILREDGRILGVGGQVFKYKLFLRIRLGP
jgi:hypothetical protein